MVSAPLQKLQARGRPSGAACQSCWAGDPCMITPDDAGAAMLEAQLKAAAYDCVVIGGAFESRARACLFLKGS